MGHPEQVGIKLYDPCYLEEKIAEISSHPSYSWNFANEQAVAKARSQNSELSDEKLEDIIHSNMPQGLSGEDLATHYLTLGFLRFGAHSVQAFEGPSSYPTPYGGVGDRIRWRIRGPCPQHRRFIMMMGFVGYPQMRC